MCIFFDVWPYVRDAALYLMRRSAGPSSYHTYKIFQWFADKLTGRLALNDCNMFTNLQVFRHNRAWAFYCITDIFFRAYESAWVLDKSFTYSGGKEARMTELVSGLQLMHSV